VRAGRDRRGVVDIRDIREEVVISFVQRQRRRGRGRIKGRGQGLMGLRVEDEQWRRGKNRRWHRRDEVRDEWRVECARG